MLQWLFIKFSPVGGVGHEVSFCPSSFKNFSVKRKKNWSVLIACHNSFDLTAKDSRRLFLKSAQIRNFRLIIVFRTVVVVGTWVCSSLSKIVFRLDEVWLILFQSQSGIFKIKWGWVPVFLWMEIQRGTIVFVDPGHKQFGLYHDVYGHSPIFKNLG